MSNKVIEFPCGCKFNLDSNRRVIFDPDIENINLGCQKTWKLIGNGNTKGVFQLESRLGRSIAKKLKPETIEHLSALLAIVRPGALESIRDNKSVTQHYIDRKNGEESVDYFHPALEPILKDTYGEMVYQEQAMAIAKEIAGFTLQQADDLRKAIGKKKANEMAKVKIQFIKGCEEQQIVNTEEAEAIFSWIEKSQRYSFNHCIDPNAVVETPDGLKAINELQIGDKVLAPKDDNIDEFVEVVDVIDCGEKEVYEITTSSGESIICTMDHKLLCEDGEMRPLYEILSCNLEIMLYND